jgi:hypothetical protein
VLSSHARRAGWQVVPGALPLSRLGLPADHSAASATEFAAQVLGRILDSGLHAYDGDDGRGHGALINYTQLPDAARTICRHFGIPVTTEHWAAMSETAQWDAKNPKLPHVAPPNGPGRAAATAELDDIADRWMGPAYLALENARRS